MDRWRERKKTRVTGVTFHHRMLWSAARELIREADEEPGRRWHGYLAALLLAFFSFEGLLNYIGEELYPDEWSDEKVLFSQGPRRGATGKFEYLSDRLGVPFDRSRRPYQSLQKLSAFRRSMVHVRHEKIEAEVVTSIEEIGKETHIPPIVAGDSVREIRADLEELGAGLFQAAQAKGLQVTGESSAFTGTVYSHGYDDLP